MELTQHIAKFYTARIAPEEMADGLHRVLGALLSIVSGLPTEDAESARQLSSPMNWSVDFLAQAIGPCFFISFFFKFKSTSSSHCTSEHGGCAASPLARQISLQPDSE